MTRRRFFLPRDLIRDGSASLPPDQAHHLRDVLRLKSGDVVEIFSGEGDGYVGEVDLLGSEVRVRGLQLVASEQSSNHLILAPALIKSARFEWMLQKAAELGVEEIIPLKTRRSDVRISESKIESRLRRWERIVLEASKQCRRLTIPRLRPPLQFPDFLHLEDMTASTRLLFHEKAEDLLRLQSVLSDKIVLCIGPEGGWDGNEIDQARAAGYRMFNLGPRILRAETAALAAVSVVQFQISNLFSKENF